MRQLQWPIQQDLCDRSVEDDVLDEAPFAARGLGRVILREIKKLCLTVIHQFVLYYILYIIYYIFIYYILYIIYYILYMIYCILYIILYILKLYIIYICLHIFEYLGIQWHVGRSPSGYRKKKNKIIT